MEMLSSFEIQKRLLKFNLTGSYAELKLGSVPPEQEVCFMYPSMIRMLNSSDEQYRASLEAVFGPIDETEEEFNKRVNELP